MSHAVHSLGGTAPGSRSTGPQRMCIGCRERDFAKDLIRVVAVAGACVLDEQRRMPGRGAHLHPRPDCLALAERRRAFPRALRVSGPLDLTVLADWIGKAAAAATADSSVTGWSGSRMNTP